MHEVVATNATAETHTIEALAAQNAELRRRLEEAEDTLTAIRTGTVDAFVMEEPQGGRVYTLDTADRPYRLFVEQMQQGAATLQPDGTIAYCNHRLSGLLKVPHERIVGSWFGQFVTDAGLPVYEKLLAQPQDNTQVVETELRRSDGTLIPVELLFHRLTTESRPVVGVLITDLTSRNYHQRLSAAIEDTKRAEENLRNQYQRSALLAAALQDLLAARNPDSIARELFSKVAGHLGVDTFFNYMIDEKRGGLRLYAYAGIPEDVAHRIEHLDLGQAISGTVASTRQAIVATNIQNSDYDKAALVRSLGIQAYACNPLMISSRLLGTLSFASRTRTRFEPDELDFLSTVSRYVAVAIDRLTSENELMRINRVAVGRELRVIELKKEVNELCLRHGSSMRYPLEFENDASAVRPESRVSVVDSPNSRDFR
jgi:PAS domain S-box-containing protein